MPSFDVVSEIDMHEANNAIDQANREVSTRFDFKGANAQFEFKDNIITLKAETDFQLKQMRDILVNKLIKRSIDLACLDDGEIEKVGMEVRRKITLRQGLETELAKKIVKMIKQEKLKVQSQIQGDKLRVTGKKRDDLQTVIHFLKAADIDMPLQFNNFRD